VRFYISLLLVVSNFPAVNNYKIFRRSSSTACGLKEIILKSAGGILAPPIEQFKLQEETTDLVGLLQ